MNNNDPGDEHSSTEDGSPQRHSGVEEQLPAAEAKRSTGLTVGIGASAGGLEAFKTFFSVMPADSGMSFILVQHLDPDYPSALVELLRVCTAMDVLTAEDGMPIRPNCVFVIPPDAVLKLDAGTLRLTRPAPAPARRVSINTFLLSLAEDKGENAVGIILSGFGSDGALGVEAIKDQGGLTLAQADFDYSPKPGMPQSAAASGFVDHVLPIREMPGVLIDFQRYRTRTNEINGPDGVGLEVADHLGAISATLHSRLGRDVSQYKLNTVVRRVQRRMQVLGVDSVPAYIKQLRERADEPSLLFREMLIRVTQFFRDPEAFEALAKQCLPGMLAKGSPQEAIRVWIPGCATGEEAYTLAILFNEAMADATRPRKVQIFATDIDDKAIDIARAGRYPDTILAHLSPSQIERYFLKEADHYRVSRDLREMCLFSVHDLVKDPPFSRLDLISCRNLMIYFTTALQKRVVEMFHYGLRPDGVLLLGTSEAFTAHGEFFAAIDKKQRLFQRLNVPTRRIGSPPGGFSRAAIRDRVDLTDRAMGGRIAQVLSQFAPAYVIIDQNQTVLHFSGPVSQFLGLATGPASLQLSSLVHPGLRATLETGLKEVKSTQSRIVATGIAFQIEDRPVKLNLVIEPLNAGDKDGGVLLVAFQEAAYYEAPLPSSGSAEDAQEELSRVRTRFEAIAQELETANEELQSTNEEYQSVNEELQSANEELETSKEELQSINEELQVVNVELNERNDDLANVNSDLVNFIDSTSIATLFLDDELRIKRFTPSILEIFNMRGGDEGRPVTDIVSHLVRDGLEGDVRQVLRTLIPVAREVALIGGGRSYQMQVRPYRDVKNFIKGVAITFVDISERKRAEQIRTNLAAIVGSSGDAIIGCNLEGLIESWNHSAEAIYEYTSDEAIGISIATLFGEDAAHEWPELITRLTSGEAIRHFDSTHRTKTGNVIDVSLTISPIRDADGGMIGASAIVRDIKERKSAEGRSALLLGELDHRVKNILAVVASIVSQTLKTMKNPEAFAASIEGRIQAIAKSHNLVTQAGRTGISLAAMLRTELAAYDGTGERVTVYGDDVTLTPKAGMALGLAFHELTTNAAKYGALSTLGGRLAISWNTERSKDGASLKIAWVETGERAITRPEKSGFGTVLIERALAHELDAEVKREFLSAGLFCRIDIPLTEEIAYAPVIAVAEAPNDGC